MFHRILHFSAIASALLILGQASARATIFTGDPFADGWLAGGRSHRVGSDAPYPNGSFAGALPSLPPNLSVPGVEYQVYSQTTFFTNNILALCGSQCSAWVVGDVIVGLGAVFPTAVNTNLPQYNPTTLVVKWGVSASAYSLSNDFNSNGAHRNHDVGEGGLGSVLAEFNFGAAGNAPTAQFQWTGITSAPLVGQFVAFRSIVETATTFRSFEAYLNVTRLNLANSSLLRLYDGNSIVGVRYYSGTLLQETNALVAGTAVPEPATGLLAAGALLAGWIVRRRRLNF